MYIQKKGATTTLEKHVLEFDVEYYAWREEEPAFLQPCNQFVIDKDTL